MNHEKAIELTNGRVRYYWEYELENYPVLEVFVNNSESEIINIVNNIANEVRDKNIHQGIVDFDYESFSENTHRIMAVFDFDKTDEESFVYIVSKFEKIENDNIEVYDAIFRRQS